MVTGHADDVLRPSVVVLFFWSKSQVAPNNQAQTNADKNRRCFQKILPPRRDTKATAQIWFWRSHHHVLFSPQEKWGFISGLTNIQEHLKGCRRPCLYLIFQQTDRADSVLVKLTLQQLFHRTADRVASSGHRSRLCWLQAPTLTQPQRCVSAGERSGCNYYSGKIVLGLILFWWNSTQREANPGIKMAWSSQKVRWHLACLYSYH